MTDVPLFDDESEPDPDLRRVTNAIIGAAIAVHRELGPGVNELAYENALALEFSHRQISFQRQYPVYVIYRETIVGEGKLDFLVDNQVIVELKAVEALAPIHTAQVISYLRATPFRLALIINFNVRLLRDGIKRVSL